MQRGVALLGVVLASVMAVAVAQAQPAPTTIVAVLSAAEEIPRCAAAGTAARGVAVFHVLDQATGLVR